MHAARTGIQGDVTAQHQRRGTVIKGMARGEMFQLLARGAGHLADIFPAEDAGAALQQFGGQQILRARDLHQHIFEFGMQTDGHIVRQGPGRGRPDDHEGPRRIGPGQHVGQPGVRQGEAHEDRGRGVVGVFHLRLGQRRMAGTAPVDGLLGADDVARIHEVGQFARGGGLVGGGHAHVGMFPVAQYAEALEFLALGVDPLAGVFPAELAHHMGGQFLLLFLEFLLDLELDGQTVAVPAGHIAGFMALHVAGLDDDVLEDLVEGRTHMDMAVGIGRAVMQHEGAHMGIPLDHGAAGVDVFPVLEHLRFALGKIGLHGEGGLGQIQGLLVVAHAGSRSGWDAPCGSLVMPSSVRTVARVAARGRGCTFRQGGGCHDVGVGPRPAWERPLPVL